MVNQSTPWVAFSLVAVLTFCACGAVGERQVAESAGSGDLAPALWEPSRAQREVGAVAAQVLAALTQRDIRAVAAWVHSTRGVRLSPYAFVAPDEHLWFSSVGLVEAWSDPAPRVWGYDDATGEAIELTLPEYLERFIWDGEYADGSDIGYNTRVGQGNTVDNAAEIYADGVTVEYHLPGTKPALEGMDWKSLRLVLARDDQQDEAWRLVAIIHDQWTP